MINYLTPLDRAVKTYWLINTGAGYHDIEISEVRLGSCKHPFQLLPLTHVRFLKDRLAQVCAGGAGMLFHNRLSLWSQSQVGEEDIASLREQKTGKAKIDAYDIL
jgi:hypothetical protein